MGATARFGITKDKDRVIMKTLLRVGCFLLSSVAILFATCNWVAVVNDVAFTACSKEGPGTCSWEKYSSFCEGCDVSLLSTDGCIVGNSYTVTGTWYMNGDCHNSVCSGGTPDPTIPPKTVTCHWVQSENCGG